MNKELTPVAPMRNSDGSKLPPGDLQLVAGFVNTNDFEGREDIPDGPTLGRWLAEYGLMDGGEPVTEHDREQALRVREALRALMYANNGVPDWDRSAVDALNAASKGAELMVRFDPAGEARLVPVRRGVDGALGKLLTIVETAQCNGLWRRMKACPDDTCGWAFYDGTKNCSGTWCSMESCGNRAKAKAFRDRRKSHAH
jgi:predicted RNA-binding Zn ribbon-like protein